MKKFKKTINFKRQDSLSLHLVDVNLINNAFKNPKLSLPEYKERVVFFMSEGILLSGFTFPEYHNYGDACFGRPCCDM